MPLSPTPNYALEKPLPGGDDDVWGEALNRNSDTLDDIVKDAVDQAAAALAAAETAQADIDTHEGRTDNPHGVTAAQIGVYTPAQVDARSTYTRPHTGAVLRTSAQYALDGWVNVKDFGAVGDGVADDTAKIQAALNAMTDVGGVLYFPPGRYVHTGLVVVGKGLTLQGAGRVQYRTRTTGAQLIYNGSPSGNWLTVKGEGVIVQDFTLKKADALTLTGGYAIDHNFVSGVDADGGRNLFTRLSIFDPWGGIRITGYPGVVQRTIAVNGFTGPTAFHLDGVTDNVIGPRLEDCTADTTAPWAGGVSQGILVEGRVFTAFIHRCYFSDMDHGVLVREGVGVKPQFIKITETEVEGTRKDGFRVEAAKIIYILDGYASICGGTGLGSNGRGIFIASAVEDFVEIRTMDVRGNGLEGIFIGGTPARGRIVNCSVASNGANNTSNMAGISFGAGCVNGWQVIGGFSGGNINSEPVAGPNQDYGVFLAAGADNITLLNVDLRGNIISPAFGGAGAFPNVRMISCLGALSETSGTAAAVSPSAAGTVTIAHGLHTTPNFVTVELLGDTVANGVEVQALDATNITARVYAEATGADITAGAFDIMWHARTLRA